MAGAGYKLFNTGDVLTAAQVNTYLQEQAVMRFADAAARTTALASVLAEGMVSYLQDTDAVEVYNGTAWVSIGSSGDITGVTAGTGISGGGTSGTVTITNDMATTITAAGDIVVGTGSGTYDNLPIGTTGQVLTADTTVSPYKVKWASSASSGGFTLLSTTTLSGSSTTITVSDTTYRHLFIDVVGVNPSANFHLYLGVNGGTTNHWSTTVQQWNGANNAATVGCGADKFNVNSGTRFIKSGNTSNAFAIWIFEYTSSNTKNITCNGNYIEDSASSVFTVDTSGVCTDTATVSSLVFTCSTGTMSGGTVKVYGVK